jgi:hypothetical protein
LLGLVAAQVVLAVSGAPADAATLAVRSMLQVTSAIGTSIVAGALSA